jgi:hypothetical protein
LISKTKLALTAILVLSGFLAIDGLEAQTQLVSRNYFPAELEFKELQTVRSEQSGDEGAVPVDAREAPLFAEAGFLHYAKRTYITDTGTDLTIEVLTAKDEKSAYSLLTLLRDSDIRPGPPGAGFAANDNGLIFTRGAFCVRIRGRAPTDLYRRIATSVSNRIGAREKSIPSLVSRFPQGGLDSTTLRYFLGPIALDSYGVDILGARPNFGPEMEIAQARYSQGGQSGTLSLISFPTNQAAESYFNSVSPQDRATTGNGAARSYAKRVGPIVGILEGRFDPAAADEILRPLKFSYSIRWIYDKNNRNRATVWGVPVGILGTVVRSLLLTALLCGMSLLLGIGMATFRVLLRGYAPNNFLDRPERTELIRLRLNEGASSANPSASHSGTNPDP